MISLRNDYQDMDATALAQKIRAGEFSAQEILECAIELSEEWNPHLNAVVHKMYEEGRRLIEEGDPQSPFYGVPFLLKDLGVAYRGTPTTASSPLLAQRLLDHDSELVRRYKKMGVAIFGKTNTPEFGIKGVTDSEFRGVCRNPWSLDHTSGGSSGGSAAAVAARIVPVAHGGDGGGSLRIPASNCGLIGLKPSRGRMPLGPARGESWLGNVVEHVITRSVRDCARFLDLTCGEDAGAPYPSPAVEMSFLEQSNQPAKPLKIAYTGRSLYGQDTHPDCIEGLEKTVGLLRDLGHELTEAHPPMDRESLMMAYMTVVCSCVAREMDQLERALGQRVRKSDVENSTWLLSLIGRAVSGADLADALELAKMAGRELAVFFEDHDALLTPTLAYPPTRIGELDFKFSERLLMNVLSTVPAKPLLIKALKELAADSFEKIPNTQYFNQTGVPAISLPLHRSSEGLPIGMQLATKYGGEGLLLQLAQQLEVAVDWQNQKPSPPR